MKNYHKNKIITSNLIIFLFILILFTSCNGPVFLGSHHTYLDRPMIHDNNKSVVQTTGKVNYNPNFELEKSVNRSAEIGFHYAKQFKSAYFNIGAFGMAGDLKVKINAQQLVTKLSYKGGGFRIGGGHTFELSQYNDVSLGLYSDIFYEKTNLLKNLTSSSSYIFNDYFNEYLSKNVGFCAEYRQKINKGHWGIAQAIDISERTESIKDVYLHHSVFITKGVYNLVGQLSYSPAFSKTAIFSLTVALNLNYKPQNLIGEFNKNYKLF